MSFGAANEHVHLVGVGGAGMSALARLLRGRGVSVSGSDAMPSEALDALRQLGIDAWAGAAPQRVPGGAGGHVVRSAAVPLNDPEVARCLELGYRSSLYAEAVGVLSRQVKSFALSGAHGKTSTTALTAAALRGGGLDPSHLIGGDVPELGGNGYGGSDPVLVVEACEFNRSFLHLDPFAAAVLNVDHDHFDCYPTRRELHDAYAAFAARVRSGGALLVHEDVPTEIVDARHADVRLLRVGFGLFADVRAVDTRDDCGRFSFEPVIDGERLPRVQLRVTGRFHVHNALFALAMARIAGADPEGACRGLSEFRGVQRRFELRHGAGGGTVVSDYAHHPAEIRAVLRAARQRFPGRRLLVAFQPHQYQRTHALLDDFAEVLADAEHVLIADIYGARESAEIRAKVRASDLVEAIRVRGGSADVGGGVRDLCARVQAARKDSDLVLMLGAGDIDGAVDDVVAAV